ncbi:MAG: sigma-70 family RNA polymerase sigma factor [Planctomycetota bacterium]
MTAADPGIHQQLQRHQAFLQRLARTLARSEHDADDLVQQACVIALDRPPTRAPTRGWLRRVLHSVAGNEARRARRQRRRDAAVAADPAAGSAPDAIVEALARQEAVLAAVRRLDPPLQRVVWLRYYRDLAPAEIARRLGEPVATVKDRLLRARRRLRATLATDYRGRTRALWLCPWIGGLGMTAKATWSAGLAAAALLGWLAWGGGPDGAMVPPDGAEAPLAGAPAHGVPAGQSPQLRTERSLVAGGPVESSAAADRAVADGATADALRSGRVIDLEGRGAPNVGLRWGAGGDRRCESAVDGSFAVPRVAADGLRVDDPRWVAVTIAVGRDRARDGAVPPLLRVVAPASARSGRVLDLQGAPIDGAALELEPPPGFRTRLPVVLDDDVDARWRATSSPSGTFRFDGVPAVAGVVLSVQSPGYLPQRLLLGAAADGDLELRLQPSAGAEGLLTGLVVRADGRPAADARVSLGAQVARTDADGRFRLEREPTAADAGAIQRPQTDLLRLCAVEPGCLPAQLELPAHRDEWPETVLLQLGGPPLAIRGRVVDPSGRGLAGRKVFLDRLTWFSRDHNGQTLENLLAGHGDRRWVSFATEADGSFELPGLLDRDYVVVAADPDTMQQVRSAPTRAGTDGLQLVLDPHDCWDSVQGRVVTMHGDPVASATVTVLCTVGGMYYGETLVRGSTLATQRATADEHGVFELRQVPKQGVSLMVDGPEVMQTRHFTGDRPIGDPALPRLRGLELVATVRVHLQVRLRDPAEATHFAVLDRDGAPMRLQTWKGKPMLGTRAELLEGRSHVLTAPVHGCWLQLLRGDQEVRRVPLILRPGDVNLLQP